jgi:O-antigen ligase
MGTILFYIVLISFWLEKALDLQPQKIFGLSMGMSLNNISIFLLLLGWIFAVKSQKSLFNRNGANVYMILLIFFILVSNFIEVLSFDHLSNIRQFKILKYQIVNLKNFLNPWIYFFFLAHILKSKKDCRNAILGIIILVFVTAATGLVDQFTALNLGTKVQGLSYEEGRSAGFGEANQYAAFLVLALPIVFSYTIFQKDITKKIAYAILFMVGFLGLITTVSRGGYVGFIIAICAFLIMSIRQKMIRVTRTFLLFVLFIPIIGSISYISLPTATKDAFRYKMIEKAETKKYVNPYGRKDRSKIDIYTSGRIGRWSGAFALFLKSPIWGHGNYTINKVLKVKPHNDYLKILIRYGVIGFFLFLMIHFEVFRQILLKIKNTSNDSSKRIYLGFISGFIGYMVCMFGVGLGIPNYIFWMYTAAVIKYSQKEIVLDNHDLSTQKDKSVGLSYSNAGRNNIG